MVRTNRTRSTAENEGSRSPGGSRGKIKDGGTGTKTTNDNTSDGAVGGIIPHSTGTVECMVCVEEVQINDKAISCQKCEKWTHQSCANLNNQEYKVLEKGKLNVMWFCNTCTGEVSRMLRGISLPNITEKGHDCSSASKLEDVTRKLDRVTETMQKMVDVLAKRDENLDRVVEAKVSKYMEEKSEKEKRECNLIFHNIPEAVSDDIEERKGHDVDEVMRVLTKLDVKDNVVSKPIRLGKKDPESSGPRLLKVTVDDVSVKNETLRKARQLKEHIGYAKVFITPDLTPQERQENRKLREELRNRCEQGEENIAIRGGKIVKLNFTFRGNSGAGRSALHTGAGTDN